MKLEEEVSFQLVHLFHIGECMMSVHSFITWLLVVPQVMDLLFNIHQASVPENRPALEVILTIRSPPLIEHQSKGLLQLLKNWPINFGQPMTVLDVKRSPLLQSL
jgi:hypothetical protein